MKFGHFCLPTYSPETYGSVEGHMRHLVDFIASSEDLGFDAVWANEHHFHPYGGHVPSPPIFLAALAQRTKRVRLGTSTVVLPLHNPIEIAEQLAMVDCMSGGRVDLGVGRGFVTFDHRTFGVPLDEGQSRTREGLEVILAAWTGKPFSYHGRHFSYDNLTVWPKPAQEPHPPVWVACSGTPSSFEWTARQGYKLLTVAYIKPLEKLAELTRLYRESWIDAGHDSAGYDVCTHYQVVVDEDGKRARRLAEGALQRYRELQIAAAQQSAGVHQALQASAQEDVDIPKLIDQGRVIAGTPADCVQALRRAEEELGLTTVDCNFLFGGLSYEQAERSIRLFAAEVMPRLKSTPAAMAAGVD